LRLDWLTRELPEVSIIWLLISSVLGGIIGVFFKFIFENLLPHHFTRRREIIEVKRKYSTPILLAADQLRKRLRNMIELIERIEKEGDWLPLEPPPDPQTNPEGYYYYSTLYTVAHFLGWQQILRQEVVYLDFTTTKETKTFEDFMRVIDRGFSEPKLFGKEYDGDKWVVSYVLQSIGDSMILKEDGRRYAMGFASFVKLLDETDDKQMKSSLADLGEIFGGLNRKDFRFRRIVAIHAILNAFVEYADPTHLRTEEHAYYLHLLDGEQAGKIKERIGSVRQKSLAQIG